MRAPESDAEAIERSLEDPDAFVVLFERHHRAVLRYLQRRVGPDLADELAGEAFARALRNRARYRPEHESALPWLYGIGNRLVAEHRRAERRRLLALERLGRVDGEGASGAGEAPAVPLETVQALRRLPAGERDALLLIAWGELSYAEAATALEVPVGTVRSRISRARRRLAGSFPAPAMTTARGEVHA